MEKKKPVALIVVLVLVLVAAGIGYSLLKDSISAPTVPLVAGKPEEGAVQAEGEAPAEEEAPDATAPDFTVYDKDGNTVSLSDYQGSLIVLNFWASWCGPCKSEMPDLQAVYDDEQNEDVVFLMVNATDGRRETAETALKFIGDGGYTFPVYVDTDYTAQSAYGISSLPTTILIDADFQVRGYARGAITADRLQNALDQLKAELPTDTESNEDVKES